MNLSRFFQSPINVSLFRLLSPSCSYAYMQLLGKLYYLLNRKERRLIERNIRDLLKDREEESLRLTSRKAFEGIFAHYFEKLFSAYKDFFEMKHFVEHAMEVKNIEVLDRAIARGKGVILVTAHYGAVEFIPWYLGLKGYPISVVVECQTERLKEALDKKVTCFHDLELISSSDGSQIYPRILKSLEANRIVMTECDEVDTWRRKKNRTIRLFGRDLYFDNTLDFISHRSGAAVIQVFMKRNSMRSYTMCVEEIDPGKEENGSVARSALTLWQDYVEKHPEQWYQWKKWQAMKAVS